jgi:hypothetical protein
VEDELRELKDSKKKVEESLVKALEDGAKLKTDGETQDCQSQQEGEGSKGEDEENKRCVLSWSEGERSGQSSTDISLAMTTALKKKMKLYSMTPQHSYVRML